MKDKRVILLFALVAAIWGTIGYKIFTSLNGDEEVNAPMQKVSYSEPEKKLELELTLSYQDPFLKKNQVHQIPKEGTKAVRQKIVMKHEPTPAVVIDWSVIKYFGLVKNNNRKSEIASVKINSGEYFLKQGEMQEGFLLAVIGPDSIRMNYGASWKYIKKEK